MAGVRISGELAKRLAYGQSILLYPDASAELADEDIIACENYALDYINHIPISLGNDPLRADCFQVVMTHSGKALEIIDHKGGKVTNELRLPEGTRLTCFGFGAEYRIDFDEKHRRTDGRDAAVTLDFNGKPILEFTAAGEICWQGRVIASYEQDRFFRIWLWVKEGYAGLYINERPAAQDLIFGDEAVMQIGESVRGARLFTKGAICRSRWGLPDRLFPDSAFVRNVSLHSRERQGIRILSAAFRHPSAKDIIARIKERDPEDRHNRLYMTDFRRDRILKRIEKGDGKKWFDKIRAEAIGYLEEPLPEFCIEDKIRLLPVARLIKRRLLLFSSLYRLTEDDRFLQACLRLMYHAAGFPHWNDTHFLDTAELCCGFAIAYDAIYPAIHKEARRYFAETLKEKALIPSLMEYRYGCCRTRNCWSDNSGNWNPVCNAGILMGAICVIREEEELAEEIIAGSLAGIAYNLEEFMPDGAWREGLGYWHYSIEFIAYYFDALYTSAGSVFGYMDKEGISRTMRYYLAMSGPCGAFNYGDMEPMYVQTPEIYWYAALTGDDALAAIYRKMEREYGFEENLWSMLHFDPAWDREEDGALPLDMVFRKWWVGSMRSSWRRENSIYLAFQGGRPNAGHSQMSMGNFVLDIDGVRWALDLGYDDYNLGYLDLAEDAEAWWIYRKSAEGHNCFLIAPDQELPQIYNVDSPICRFETSEKRAVATLDLSPAYHRTAVYAYREFTLDREEETVTITDRFRSRQEGAEFIWFLHTTAEIEVLEGCAVLREKEKSVLVEIADAPCRAEFDIMDTVLLESSRKITVRDREAKNEGVRKLVLRLRTNGDSRVSVRIKRNRWQGGNNGRREKCLEQRKR